MTDWKAKAAARRRAEMARGAEVVARYEKNNEKIMERSGFHQVNASFVLSREFNPDHDKNAEPPRPNVPAYDGPHQLDDE